MPKGTALITGASSGIGAELAKLCAADGHGVILVARNSESLENLARRLTRDYGVAARMIAADLADPSAPAAIFAATRGEAIEILINNAGFGLRGAFAETDWSIEASMIQVNVTALANLTKLFLPEMLRRGSGRILNVASTAAFVPGPFMSVYYATKAFVVSFSHAIANEIGGGGVTVTALCPGPTHTGFQRTAGAQNSNLFRKHVMTAEEVAREGYHAMLEGRAEIIAGARNRWMILGARLAPRTMLAALARRLNSDAASS
jgi:short-subunit dehydrogenase